MRRIGFGFLILAAVAGMASAAAAEGGKPSEPTPSLEYRPPRVVIPEPRAPHPLPPKTIFADAIGSFGMLGGSFDRPTDVARVEKRYSDDTHEIGEFYVLDAGNIRIQRFSPSGTFMGSCGSRGIQAGEFDSPTAIAVSPSVKGPNSFFVVDTGNHRIQICDGRELEDGKVIKTCSCESWGTRGSGWPTSRGPQFKSPLDIAVSRDIDIASNRGIIAILDSGNERIQFFDASRRFLNIWDSSTGVSGGTFTGLTSIAYSDERGGCIYTFGAGCVVQQFQPDGPRAVGFRGKLITSWPAIPPEYGLCVPARMEIDARFNYVYVLDSGNSKLSCYNPDGLYRWTLDGAQVPFSKPLGLAINLDGDEVLVADTENNIVQKFTLR